jgi:hypothetical protein
LLGIFGENLREDSGRGNGLGFEASENLLPNYGVIESELGVNLDFFWDLNVNVSRFHGFFWVFLGIPEGIQVRVETPDCKGRKASSNEYSQSRGNGPTEWEGFTATQGLSKIFVKFRPENTEGNDKPGS